MADEKKKLTIPDLLDAKRTGKRLVMASIPDYPSAIWAERAGLDIVAVGDSLAMVSYGHPNTLPATVDLMLEHCRAVRRGAPNTFSLVAMPYGSYANEDVAVHNALRFMKEGQVDAVKMQGGREKMPIIRAIADAGVPIMSHVGMCPHFVHRYGGFRLQGKTADDAMRIVDDALAIQEAGAIGLEIEAVPAPVGRAVHEAVDIFTFSIGAGSYGTAQLLLAFDLLGVFDQFKPKFTKRYANLSQIAVEALKTYAAEVRGGVFPDAEHSYSMQAEEVARFESRLGKKLS
ncbi:MAG: 3-methyl-2-oxobutanoate hydroxymethyltransferase [Burkholderiales bacterium]|nr:3-methyl-2-oxobutanoate hydroxymethyltransferase [Burkholderiales bacterium]MCC7115909.1 3-methyl-2-oxobutanoate hydroxymethyltransferase [Burkholderiales bacterium]